MRASMTVKGK